MAGGKWIEDVTADTPLEDGARRVLGVRLAAVRDALTQALYEGEGDVENIHELRVCTRRARAALDIFAACLPPKHYQKMKKCLRQLRQSAGPARDEDVFLQMLCEQAQGKQAGDDRAGLDFLIGHAIGRRLAARAELTESAPDGFALDRRTADVLHSVAPPGDGPRTVIGLARPTLLGLVDELDRATARDTNRHDNLHQARIVGKRLRYALEVFAGCFPDEFRTTVYAAVEELQEILGHANDSRVARERLNTLRQSAERLLPDVWQRYRPNFEELAHIHERRLTEEHRRFEEWWRRWEAGGKAALLALLTDSTTLAAG